MILKLKKQKHGNCYFYCTEETKYNQEQFDYVFKHLNFDKLEKSWHIFFNDKKTEEWFHKTYICSYTLDDIYNDSPEGYKWLKNNWGKGVFKLWIYYQDKQEFKTIVNRVINVAIYEN